ncbi:hypothetical protein ACRBEV_33280 (plasmid) [Methylobacterium phyllosphaerae]
MSELEKAEHDIATLRGRIRHSRLMLEDPNVTPEAAEREYASLERFERHMCDLLTKRDDLRSLSED